MHPQSLAALPPNQDPDTANRYLKEILPAERATTIARRSAGAGRYGSGKNPAERPTRIRHLKFGDGSIRAWSGSAAAYIVFDGGREGWFVLDHTPHEVLEMEPVQQPAAAFAQKPRGGRR
jgi:hypothetical protein